MVHYSATIEVIVINVINVNDRYIEMHVYQR